MSSADVGSSSRMIGAFFRKARAMEMRGADHPKAAAQLTNLRIVPSPARLDEMMRIRRLGRREDGFFRCTAVPGGNVFANRAIEKEDVLADERNL